MIKEYSFGGLGASLSNIGIYSLGDVKEPAFGDLGIVLG